MDTHKWRYGITLTLSLPRVINLQFPLQPHQKCCIKQYEELSFHSSLRWKMIALPILTTSPIHFSLGKVERMYFLNLGVKGLKTIWITVETPSLDCSVHLLVVQHQIGTTWCIWFSFLPLSVKWARITWSNFSSNAALTCSLPLAIRLSDVNMRYSLSTEESWTNRKPSSSACPVNQSDFSSAVRQSSCSGLGTDCWMYTSAMYEEISLIHSCDSSGRKNATPNLPPGTSTRLISAKALGVANQWKLWNAITKSTLELGSSAGKK